YLREEVYGLAPYKEDEPVAAPTAGLAEQIQVLAQLEAAPPELERALSGFASDQGLNYKRAPAAVRKAFFAELERRAAADDMPAAYATLLENVFAAHVKALQTDVPGAIVSHIEQAEALNRQITFLPPHEWPHYQQLRESRPVHYLRAAKLRLEL